MTAITGGAHPKIIERLVRTNPEQTPGYGTDEYCESAKEKIKAALRNPQTGRFTSWWGHPNQRHGYRFPPSSLRGVAAAYTGHIAVHEAGAVEASGHKVIALPDRDGKLTRKR